MMEVEVEDAERVEPPAKMVRAQLERLVEDNVFRSSKRSVAFLRYVVEQTLNGSADSIKERTIGVEVFGRQPSYDTNVDHIVRTAATELRKRLAIYYGDERHRSELRMGLIPGSYVPRFFVPLSDSHESGLASDTPTLQPANSAGVDLPIESPPNEAAPAVIPVDHGSFWRRYRLAVFALAAGVGIFGYGWLHRSNAQDLFWKPVIDTQGPVLVAVGDVPNGPPISPPTGGSEDASTPVLQADSSHTVPFGDAVTIAKVVGELESRGKEVVIRRENSRSFSDLREGPVILIGAFNNEWSVRLTRNLRFSLALDADKHLIYIKDAKNPVSRSWSWGTNQPRDRVVGARSPVQQDYALISRIRNSETGRVVVVLGGLYTYGTQAAGEFLTDQQLMQAVATAERTYSNSPNLQIVLGTTVTDETPGPPKVLMVSAE
jgi:hypothetical protein